MQVCSEFILVNKIYFILVTDLLEFVLFISSFYPSIIPMHTHIIHTHTNVTPNDKVHGLKAATLTKLFSKNFSDFFI